MVGAINKIVTVSVSLLIIFLLFSTLVLTYFDDLYERSYCQSNSTNLISCTDCNETGDDSQGWENFIENCHSLPYGKNSTGDKIDDVGGISQNNTNCFGCGDFGYRSPVRGLGLLILVLGILYFAVVYIPKRV